GVRPTPRRDVAPRSRRRREVARLPDVADGGHRLKVGGRRPGRVAVVGTVEEVGALEQQREASVAGQGHGAAQRGTQQPYGRQKAAGRSIGVHVAHEGVGGTTEPAPPPVVGSEVGAVQRHESQLEPRRVRVNGDALGFLRLGIAVSHPCGCPVAP
nr:hypothetical protein [Tanacetum cinerariifolium]